MSRIPAPCVRTKESRKILVHPDHRCSVQAIRASCTRCYVPARDPAACGEAAAPVDNVIAT
eukprot:403744-Prymnesium_polylepis.1